MNVVVVSGVLSSTPVHRVLKSGEELLSCEVTVRSAQRPTETVPVVWPAPPAAASSLGAGLEVVVTGRVRRRFFRSGGTTASRTEVVADVVVLARRRTKAAAAIGAAVEELSS